MTFPKLAGHPIHFKVTYNKENKTFSLQVVNKDTSEVIWDTGPISVPSLTNFNLSRVEFNGRHTGSSDDNISWNSSGYINFRNHGWIETGEWHIDNMRVNVSGIGLIENNDYSTDPGLIAKIEDENEYYNLSQSTNGNSFVWEFDGLESDSYDKGPVFEIWLRDNNDTEDSSVKTINFTYAITAQKDGKTASLSGLDIDDTWYREDSNTPTKTVVCNIDTGECWIEGVATGTLKGKVTDKDTGSGIEGAVVSTNGYSDTTDDSGDYSITLPTGNYTVTASKSGYQSQSKSAEVFENRTTEVNFTLTVATTTTSTTTSTITTTTLPDTTPPSITIQSPQPIIYSNKIIPLNFFANEPLDTCLLSVDSTLNQTLPNCENLSVISKEYEATSGTAAWWHFNDNAEDSSGNGNHGTVNGASFVDGKFSSGLSFNGNDWVEVNDSDSLDGFNEITIEAWVKPILGARGSIVNKYLYNYTIPINERVYELDIGADGHVNFALSSNGTGAGTVWLTSDGVVNNNTWTHIAATSDGTTMRIFINGEQDPNTTVAPSSIHSSPYNLYIGAWQWSPTDMGIYFNGEIDELRILNRALTGEEILEDYALRNGSHSVTVYGNDTAGNWNSSTVYFGIGEGTTTTTSTSTSTTTTTIPGTTTTTISTTTTIIWPCDLPGDYPTCGEVTLEEVVDFINLWSLGQAELGDVVNLINAWAGGPVCELPGDYPPCGEVTLEEVVDFINLWVEGQAELGDVVNLINAWAGS